MSKNVGSTTPSSSKSWRGAGTGGGGIPSISVAAAAKTYPPPPARASTSTAHQQQQYSVIAGRSDRQTPRSREPATPGHSKHQQQQQKQQQQNDIMSFIPPAPPSSHQYHHHHKLQHGSKHWTSASGGEGGHVSNSAGGGAGRSTCGSGVVSATSALPGAGGDIENIDTCSRNPLFCLICNNVFEDPRLLSCYHSFCAKCLDGRAGDTKITCPLCGKVTALKDSSGPPPDLLLRFLLHSTTDIQPPCANCDNKTRVPMYYCNTCGQVLCNGCREETHRAKMFSTHDMIPVSKYTKETPKKCSIHGEQYIMFSTVQKAMLCINCYRDTATEARLHCVDLETAYSQGCRKLERAVNNLRDLQVAVRDGITMLKSVLEELRRNSDSEKSAVNAVCQTILDALTKTQENLLRDVDCQMEVKDKVIRGQLSQLRAVLPTIKLHLTMCATISNATSKYDFLDLAYPLIDRLTAITHMGYPIRPGQSSQIKSSYKSEIARTLEPWISGTHPQVTAMMTGVGGPSAAASTASAPFLSSTSTSQLPKDYAHPSINLTSVDPTFSEPTYSQYYPMSRSTVTPIMGHKPTSSKPTSAGNAVYAAPSSVGITPTPGRKTPSKLKSMADGLDEQFAAHCRAFTTHLTELSQRLGRLKEQVQELHRDVTTQRGGSYSSYAARAETCLREGLSLEELLNRRQTEMERIKKLFESTWNEHMRQVRIEQEVFQTQMSDLLALKAEVKQLSSMLQQLQTFLKSAGAHHQQQGPGSGGPPPGPSSGGSSSGPGHSSSGQGLLGKQQQQQQSSSHQQQSFHDNKGYHHLPTAADVLGRVESSSSSQVMPSLSEMVSSAKGLKGSKKDSSGSSSVGGLSAKQAELSSRLGRFSISRASSAGSGAPAQQQQQPTGRLHEMDYIQVDTSYPQQQQQRPAQLLPTQQHHHHHKKGMLSQLINKVRPSKDDRKKSTTTLPSAASGVIPMQQIQQQQQSMHHPPPPPPSASTIPQHSSMTTAQAMANLAAAQRGRTAMYDAQVQYGTLANFPDTSAVTALRRSGSQRQKSSGNDKSIYTRAKSFVKSKSDDERPPSKLSRESRARSIAALETESLLRSLSASTGSKEASRLVLSLYQTLLSDKENPPTFTSPYFRPTAYSSVLAAAARQQQLENAKQQQQASRQQAQQQQMDSAPRYSTIRRSGTEGLVPSDDVTEQGSYLSEDDYQQIPFSRFEPVQQQQQSMPHYQTMQRVMRSDSASLRKPSVPPHATPLEQQLFHDQQQQQQFQSTSLGRSSRSSNGASSNEVKETDQLQLPSSTTQVKVFVHEEPGARSSVSSSPPPRPPARLAKSFEETTPYMYGFLSPPTSGTGSGSSGSGGAERHILRKPASCESLVSLGSNNEKSSIDFDRRSVVTVRRAGSGGSGLIRQHSWEGGINVSLGGSLPRTSGSTIGRVRSSPLLSPGQNGHSDDEDEFGRSSSSSGRRNPFEECENGGGGQLHKADSFEGHEEAVRSIVAVVQETRRERSKEKSSQMQSILQ